MTDKNDLRKNAKYIRETLSISEKSELAVAQIRKHSFYKNATNILIYYPFYLECADKIYKFARLKMEIN